MHSPLLKLPTQVAVGLLIASQQENTRRFSIQAMYGTQRYPIR
jgi:hypothetical protein